MMWPEYQKNTFEYKSNKQKNITDHDLNDTALNIE